MLDMDIAQPDGGCRGRKREQDHRTGLAPEIRSGLCGAQCAGILHRKLTSCAPVCDIGAVLPAVMGDVHRLRIVWRSVRYPFFLYPQSQ